MAAQNCFADFQLPGAESGFSSIAGILLLV
jgi:hypothetical protein